MLIKGFLFNKCMGLRGVTGDLAGVMTDKKSLHIDTKDTI